MSKIKVGITQGDINGISYEVILKTLEDNRISELCTPIIYGSPKVAAYHRKMLNLNINLNLINKPEEALEKRANIINCCNDEIKVEVGFSTPQAGDAAFKALEKATKDLKDGKIDVLVTAPINKNNIQSNKTYYIVVDSYTSTYKYNNLTEIERLGPGIYARDLLAQYILDGRLK